MRITTRNVTRTLMRSDAVMVVPSEIRGDNNAGTKKFQSGNLVLLIFFAFLFASPAQADEAAQNLAPAGTLRATYIATNPVQASIDPSTNEVRGPAGALARELAKRAGLPVTITGAKGVEGVIESVKNGEADIG